MLNYQNQKNILYNMYIKSLQSHSSPLKVLYYYHKTRSQYPQLLNFHRIPLKRSFTACTSRVLSFSPRSHSPKIEKLIESITSPLPLSPISRNILHLYRCKRLKTRRARAPLSKQVCLETNARARAITLASNYDNEASLSLARVYKRIQRQVAVFGDDSKRRGNCEHNTGPFRARAQHGPVIIVSVRGGKRERRAAR